MKKFFDRYLFSRMGLQILASIVVIFVFSLVVTLIRNCIVSNDVGVFFSRMSWGFRQLADGGSITATLEELDQMPPEPVNIFVLIIITFVSWAVGLILCAFVTGAIVNAFDGRKEKIKNGQTRYKFKEHGIVLGWDYQGIAVVKNMLFQRQLQEVLVVSEKPTDSILSALSQELNNTDIRKVYIYNCAINAEENIREIQAEFAKVIVILGENNTLNKDGETLHSERLLKKYIETKIPEARIRDFSNLPIKIYIHLEDPILYVQARSQKNSITQNEDKSQNFERFDVELCNFYESWAWQCWSKIGSEDITGVKGKKYLPLRYKKDSERVELFVMGSNAMGYSMVKYAIPLINYGKNKKHCRVTLFDENSSGAVYLPEKYIAEELPEVEVVHKMCSGTSEEANAVMQEAINRDDTSVTIVIAEPEVDAVVKAYCALSYKIRRKPVSVLVWQNTPSGNCIDKSFLKFTADKTQLRYFGMTDILPWLDTEREEYGKKIEFYYEMLYDIVKKTDLSTDKLWEFTNQLLQISYTSDDKTTSESKWNKKPRWKRWSSINNGDSFKEKQNSFHDCLDNPEKCLEFSHAEHNRWWTERLLTGWIYGEVKEDAEFKHHKFVEFEKLDAKTQACDLISILAMNDVGLLKGSVPNID